MQVSVVDKQPYTVPADDAAQLTPKAESSVEAVAQDLLSSEKTHSGADSKPCLSPKIHRVSEDASHADIQVIAQNTLPASAKAELNQLSVPAINLTGYERAFENLRRHVYSLGNPYLVKMICEKLSLVADELDISSEEVLMSSFLKSPISCETKEYLRLFFATIVRRATDELDAYEKVYRSIKTEIVGFCEKLSVYNAKVLEDYKGWHLFEILFKLPGFSSLRDVDFRKLMKWIDLKAPEQLLEEITRLVDTNALDREKAEEDLEQLRTEYELDEEYDLDTLLSQVTETKPGKHTGILTYWNHPKEFFVQKTLHIHDPQGLSYSGSIADCKLEHENGHEKMVIFMEDRSEVHITKLPSISVCLYRNHVHKLWSSIEDKSLENEMQISVEHKIESNHPYSIQSGKYDITNLNIGRNWKLQKYLQFELKHKTNPEICYQLLGYYEKQQDQECEKIISIEIEKWDPRRKKYGNKKIECLGAFESSHRFSTTEKEVYSRINLSNIEELIIINQDLDENKIRLRYLKQIKERLNEITSQLKQDGVALKRLIDDLVKNQLTKVDFQILNEVNPSIAKEIKDLSQTYYDNLKSERTPADILKQVVLEANYSSLVDKQDTILIARTMELLRAAQAHVDRIRGHDLVLFMGDTGSGKSTSIGHLMNANLEEHANHVGEKVLRIKKNAADYPKIGQSIGTSETIYTQGFQPAGYNCLLGDCPGSNDTRGGDFELCTNFSIDQAVDAAENIRALVIVIPAAAFVLAKGNEVVKLITQVRERFFGIFDPNSPEKNKRVYLLVTKQNQVQPEVLQGLKNGSRFLEFVGNMNSQIKELESKYEADSVAVSPTKTRAEIWNAIYQMHSNSQIHFINIKDRLQRKKLLELYANTSECVDKGIYLSAMATPFMQDKFGGCVKMSAHSWTHHILDKFLTLVPNEITTIQQEIEINKNILESAIEEKRQKEQAILDLAEECIRLEAHIECLKSGQDTFSEEGLNEELILAQQQIDSQLEKAEKNLQETIGKLNNKNRNLDLIRSKIKNLECIVDQARGKILNLKKELKLLKTQFVTDQLYKYKPLSHFIVQNKTWKSAEARAEALEELCVKDEHFTGETKEFNSATYTGTTKDVVIIDRGYRLISSDANLQEQFFMTGESDGYVAKVEGLRYRLGLGKAQADGKKIGYPLELDWVANEELPWIKITFTIPGREYHRATIVDKKSEINLYEDRIKWASKALDGDETTPGLKITQNDERHEIQNLFNEKDQIYKKIQDLRDAKKNNLARIADLLEHEKNELEQLRNKEPVLQEEVRQQKAIIKRYRTTIASQKEKIEQCETKLRNLAIIIATQWENAVQLREFAGHVVNLASGSDKAKSETVKSCEEFIEVFEKNKGNLLQEIKSKYGF